jgi:cytosine/adenosine deaminase-related metal-dependent hydrolase
MSSSHVFRSRHARTENRPRLPVPRDQAADARALDRLRTLPAGDRTVLLRGATVVTMDPAIGTLRGDVLIRGEVIAEVGGDLGRTVRDDTCVAVDATGTVVMPGFVDSHVHAWQGQMRGLAPAIDFPAYMDIVHGKLSPHYRPHDIYMGTVMTALQALDGGVTTIIDNFHNSRTYEHSEAAVEAVLDAGIRAVHAAGAPIGAPDHTALAENVLRLRNRYFSTEHQLVTLRLFDAAPTVPLWEFAKQHSLWMSHEMGAGLADNLAELNARELLTERHTFNHCFGTADSDWKLIADSGAQVNLAPRSDATFGLGPAHPPVDQALGHGIRPGLSMDNEISYGLDMFTEMQALLTGHRSRSFESARHGRAPRQLAISDVLEFATLRGAANAGLDHLTGSITPGKAADVILVSTSDLNTAPSNNVESTLVGFANRCNVDTVFVAGQVRKWRGRLVDVDLGRVRAVAEQSRDHVLAAAGLDSLRAG